MSYSTRMLLDGPIDGWLLHNATENIDTQAAATNYSFAMCKSNVLYQVDFGIFQLSQSISFLFTFDFWSLLRSSITFYNKNFSHHRYTKKNCPCPDSLLLNDV